MLLESGSSKYISNCSDDSLAECDISVSKLLGFETSRFRNFSIFGVVSDSVSKIFGIKKSIGFGIVQNLVSEKVSDSVSKKFGIEKVSDSVS